jgi:hypothetical protein
MPSDKADPTTETKGTMTENEETVVALKIAKPSSLDRFKSKRAPSIAGVETLLTAVGIEIERTLL